MASFPFLLHPLSVVTAILLLSATIWAIRILPTRLKRRTRRHPVRGTVFHLARNFGRIYHHLTEIASQHRSFRILHLFRWMVVTADPANVEHILKTNFPNYCKGWFQHEILSDLLGEGIFTVDGEPWQHQRKVSSHEFSTRILRDFSCDVFRNNASKFALLLSQAASDRSVEIQDLFMKFGMDTTFQVLLGTELDSLRGTNEEGAQFSKAFNEANLLVAHRYVDILWKIKRFLNIGTEAMIKDSVKVVDDFVYRVIRSKIEQNHEPQDPSFMKSRDIVSRFLESDETDPKFLRDIAISFIIAGKDTTAITLCWFIYMLCKQPNLQETIAKEVKEVIGVGDGLGFVEIANSISEEVLNKMHYLHATLTETLRLYPAIPVDIKLCVSDDEWPDGFTVSKGDVVVYLPYSMGRMTSLWGDDAEVFRSERWLNDDGVFQHASSFKFTAFNAGPRICLGKDFAYRQMKILSAVLVYGFVFMLSDEKSELKYKVGLTLNIAGGLHVRASLRQCKNVM